jgi:hypothetical protein
VEVILKRDSLYFFIEIINVFCYLNELISE